MNITRDEGGHPDTGVDGQSHRRMRLTTVAAEGVSVVRAGFCCPSARHSVSQRADLAGRTFGRTFPFLPAFTQEGGNCATTSCCSPSVIKVATCWPRDVASSRAWLYRSSGMSMVVFICGKLLGSVLPNKIGRRGSVESCPALSGRKKNSVGRFPGASPQAVIVWAFSLRIPKLAAIKRKKELRGFDASAFSRRRLHWGFENV